ARGAPPPPPAAPLARSTPTRAQRGTRPKNKITFRPNTTSAFFILIKLLFICTYAAKSGT
ncbi:MAG: hypothetical protein RML94_12560, partial [Bacteroidia bacterium]|nr:hypothetical protein [Bacteroidia bacterium]